MERNTLLIIDGSETSKLKERLEKRSEINLVGSTNNVDLGFTMAERHQPAIILLNVDMPGEKGFNAAEVFALEFPTSSLILVTEWDNQRILRHALQVGAKEVITLPVSEDQLWTVVQRVLAQQKKRREVFSLEKNAQPQFKTITVFSTKGGGG
ncbi:MAG TPA: response regulator [Bacillota bacterium]|nr:response regulator [Bacillota bacterium]